MSTYPFPHRGQPGILALTLKPVPTVGDTKISMNHGSVCVVESDGDGGAYVHYEGPQGSQEKERVDETPAEILALGLGAFEFTYVPRTGVSRSLWVPYDNIARIESYQGSSTLSKAFVSRTWNGIGDELKVNGNYVTLINSIIAASASASSIQYIAGAGTTQGTATGGITAENVIINSGGEGTGIVLTAGMASLFVANQTTTNKIIYPESGGNHAGMAANAGLSLPPNESVFLKATTSGWVSEDDEYSQKVAASGTVQGGGVVQASVKTVYITSAIVGNTAITLPVAVVGKTITIHHMGSSVAKVFPAVGDQLFALGANNSYNLEAGQSMKIVCRTAGTWEDEISQITKLAVSVIEPPALGGTIDFQETSGTSRVAIKSGSVDYAVGQVHFQQSVTGTVGGSDTTATMVELTTVATEDYGAKLATASNNFVIASSLGAEIGAIRPATGKNMNGDTDRLFPLTNGAVAAFARDSASNGWVGGLLFPGRPHELIAYSGGGSANAVLVKNPYVTITECAAYGDSVLLNNMFRTIVITNAGAFPARVYAPSSENINGATTTNVILNPNEVGFFTYTAYRQWTFAVREGQPVEVTAAGSGSEPYFAAKDVIITSTGASQRAYYGDDFSGTASGVVPVSVIANISSNGIELEAVATLGFTTVASPGTPSSTYTVPANKVVRIVYKKGTDTYFAAEIG